MVGSFTVGSWRVDPDLDQLSRGTEVVKVRRQVMDVLVYLAERPGQMVGSDELLDGVWSGKFVTGGSVYNCVAELRRALASDTQETYIETIPKRGYRLVAPVTGISRRDAGDTVPASGLTKSRSALHATVIGVAALVVLSAYLALDRSGTPDMTDRSVATEDDGAQSSLVPAPRVSVAVLPFVNLSTDAEQEFLADGIAEEVANSLAKLPALRVTGRTSAFYFKGRNVPIPEIGETLGVQYVVEGSLRREEEKLRVRYQVSRAEDGFQVWSDTRDHSADSILAMEHDVALSIARALDVVLDATDRESMYAVGTRNVDAYRHFLRGRELIYAWLADGEEEQIWRANEWFDQAILADSRFAAAYSLRSYAYIQFLDGGLSSPAPPRAGVSFSAERAVDLLRNDVAKAIRYADDPGVRIVNQFRQVLYSDDFTALPALAGQVDPLALANTPDVLDIDRVLAALLLLGMEDTAMTVAELRVQRNPLDSLAYNHAWGAAFVAGDTPRAMEYLERGVSIVGTGHFFEHNRLMTEFVAGHMDEVVRLAEDPEWGVAAFRSSIRALAYSVVGRSDEARGIIDQLLASNQQDILLAIALREVGEADAAMQMLQKIDARPDGALHFIYTFKEFGGRLPFDLAWTPNFSARLAEAGVAPETFDLHL